MNDGQERRQPCLSSGKWSHLGQVIKKIEIFFIVIKFFIFLNFLYFIESPGPVKKNFIVRPDLKICWFVEQSVCPVEQSEFVLLFVSFFSFLCCFDFSYPLLSVQVSLDCATLGHQINQRKIRQRKISNVN